MARPKDRALERLWRQRLRRHSTSGPTIAEFCTREGVTAATLSYWKRRLAAEPRSRSPEPPLFVALRVDESSREAHPLGTARGIEIELPHQVRLRLDRLPEPQWLGRVVDAMAIRSEPEVTR